MSAPIATTRRPSSMSKRAKTSGLEAGTTVVSSAAVQFRLDYEQAKQLPIGTAVCQVISAGGHLWRIECYPRGESEDEKGGYISIHFALMSKNRNVKAICEAFLLDRDGKPSATPMARTLESFENIGHDLIEVWGFQKFVKRNIVEKNYVIEGHVTFVCAIMVIDDSLIPVPPSDMGTHLGSLLDHTDGTDVSFIIDGETFYAHRAVLAARSPVFRAELFGSMAEAIMPSIMLHDITPSTFKVMLHFIYTDDLPGEDELADSPIEMFQNLLAAADRYALDRLKFICAQKLLDEMSVDTVATILACPETYNCPELKNKCIDFFVVEENFKEVMFTEAYALLVLKFPLLTAELRKRVRT